MFSKQFKQVTQTRSVILLITQTWSSSAEAVPVQRGEETASRCRVRGAARRHSSAPSQTKEQLADAFPSH